MKAAFCIYFRVIAVFSLVVSMSACQTVPAGTQPEAIPLNALMGAPIAGLIREYGTPDKVEESSNGKLYTWVHQSLRLRPARARPPVAAVDGQGRPIVVPQPAAQPESVPTRCVLTVTTDANGVAQDWRAAGNDCLTSLRKPALWR